MNRGTHRSVKRGATLQARLASIWSFATDLKTSIVNRRGTGSATFTRATTATVWGYAAAANLADGQTLLTAASGEARFTGARRVSEGVWSALFADGTAIPDATLKGYLAEGARTQYLGVTDTPATQTTASLATGTYTLWVNGTGSALASGGTATITGAAAATDGAPDQFEVTVAGTVTVTVTGSLTRFQLELGAFASSYIPNSGAAGTSVTRNADVLRYDGANMSATVGTAYAEAIANWPAPGTVSIILASEDVNGGALLRVASASAVTTISAADGTGSVEKTGLTDISTAIRKRASTWNGTNLVVAGDGAAVETAASAGNFGAAYIQVGGGGFGQYWFGNIRNVRIAQVAVSENIIKRITA